MVELGGAEEEDEGVLVPIGMAQGGMRALPSKFGMPEASIFCGDLADTRKANPNVGWEGDEGDELDAASPFNRFRMVGLQARGRP